ncbi:hypothetical protein F5Y14DRAFT_426113 [Nemania sp. NC0429]|nr:hypothetical protein F5Y14DRAFT_426113 [Nemania sp. NC0429]
MTTASSSHNYLRQTRLFIMNFWIAIQLYGLIVATVTVAQGDDIPDLIADGPFALRVKGRAHKSPIDGYLHTVVAPAYLEAQLVLHYDATSVPDIADNSSYRFYFNYTGNMQSKGNELGFFVSDITVGEPNPLGLLGKAMSLQYKPNTNVALPVLGASAGTVDLTGFDRHHEAFLDYYSDDATSVPNQPANVSLDINYYSWAICWQTYWAVYGPTLSWITTGKPHNPTCELVDLLRAEL